MTPTKTLTRRRAPRWSVYLTTALLNVLLLLAPANAQVTAKRSFNIASGEALDGLKQFAQQSGVEVLYSTSEIAGTRTKAVQGDFVPSDALNLLLSGSGLVVTRGKNNGGLAITRSSDPNEQRAAQNIGDRPVRSADGSGGSTIEGRILNTRTGAYLEKARVTVEGTTLEAFTDSGGYYRLSNVPAGAANVRVFFTGLDPLAETITVVPGDVVQRDFNLPPLQEGERSGRQAVVRLSEFVVGASREMDGAAIAINEQRFAPNITNVVSAGEFGISADGSVGEFLKFLPGISINYAGGTANTLSMNGVPDAYVPVTLGGFDLASTSGGGMSRAVELLQISIHNISRIEVLHSPTPESPGSALAGSVNMVPRSAFERSRPVFNGSVYMMMRDNDRSFDKTPGPRKHLTRKVQPGFDFSYIAPVNKRFGFTLSGSYSNQYIPEDRIVNTWRGTAAATTGLTAATAATQFPDTTPDRPYLTTVAVTDLTKFNQRSSLGATLDYKIAANDTLSFSFQYGAFDSEFNNNTLTFLINRVQPGDFTPASTRGTGGRDELRIMNGARWREGSTYMPSLVYRHTGPIWKAESGFAYSHSTNFNDDIERGYFGSIQARRSGVNVSFDDIFYLRPRAITVTDGATAAAIDPHRLDTYALNTAGSPNPRDTIDVKRSAYANVRRDFDVRGVPFTLKGGIDVRQSMRDERGQATTWTFVGTDARASSTPTAAGSDDGARIVLDEDVSQRIPPYGFPRTEWMSADDLWDLYQAQPQYFTSNENNRYRSSVDQSKHAEEIISSAYLRGDLALLQRRLKLVGGIRAEQTNVNAEGPLDDPTRNFQRDASGRVIVGTNGRPLPISTDALSVSRRTYIDRGQQVKKEYLRLFPSLNASFNVRENLIARASFYASVGRPNFNQYAGGIDLPDIENAPGPGNSIVVNNAAIKAWSARTTKVRLEYYFEGVGQVSVGGFVRDFDNFFGDTTFPATPEFLALYALDPAIYGGYDVVTQHNISSTVRMTGLEFDYKQALTFLPHWARGVQVFANASAVRATGEAAENFRGYVPRTYNWGISLRREKYNLRMNWNYRGTRRTAPVDVARGIEPGTFNWISKRLTLDLQGEYYFLKRFALFANLRNFNDATEDMEIYGPSTPAHAQFRQRQDFGGSWTFGVKGSF